MKPTPEPNSADKPAQPKSKPASQAGEPHMQAGEPSAEMQPNEAR